MTAKDLIKILQPTMNMAFFSTRSLSILMQTSNDGGRAEIRTLARALGISKPAVSRVVDNLSITGLVRRRRGIDDDGFLDRRRVAICLTDKGHAFVKQLLEAA